MAAAVVLFERSHVEAQTSGDRRHGARADAATHRTDPLLASVDAGARTLRELSQQLPSLPPYRDTAARNFNFDGKIESGYESAGALFLIATKKNGAGRRRAVLLSTSSSDPREIRFGRAFRSIAFWSFEKNAVVLRAVDLHAHISFYRLRGGSVVSSAPVPVGHENDRQGPGSGVHCDGANITVNGSTAVARDTGLSVRDSSGRLLTNIPSGNLSWDTDAANFDPTVSGDCHSFGKRVLVWLASGSDDADGVTYEVRGQFLVAISGGIPIVVMPNYILFRRPKRIAEWIACRSLRASSHVSARSKALTLYEATGPV